MMTASTRNRLHNLIDQLPDRELPAAERYLASLKERTNPFLQALANAPEEDEPLSAEEKAAIDESYARIKVEGIISDDEVWRRLNDAPSH